MDWRELKRHPLSAEYRDITGPAWFAFCQGFKTLGFIADCKIVLHEGMVLEGWQRHRACIETNTEPEFAILPEGVDPRTYVECRNDKRRHETSEEKQARIGRTAQARADGKSLRQIADEEGVSASQTRRDLEDAKSTAPPHGAVGAENGKIIGKDGKTRPASPMRPRCDRCKRMWPEIDQSVTGCIRCIELRTTKPTKKIKKAQAPKTEVVLDDAGEVVPQRLIEVFRMCPVFDQAALQLNRTSALFKQIEEGPTKDAKPINANQHYRKYYFTFKSGRARLMAMRPSLVCKSCAGDGADGCLACGGSGWLTRERAEAQK